MQCVAIAERKILRILRIDTAANAIADATRPANAAAG
jgi:hypothetical protein